MVYTAGSAALAALEMLAHVGQTSLLPAYVLIACAFHKKIVLRLDRKRLPRDWHSYPARPELQLVGDAWLKDATSAVLEVPNAIIPSESNFLLNPKHGDFKSIGMAKPQPLEFDLRWLRG